MDGWPSTITILRGKKEVYLTTQKEYTLKSLAFENCRQQMKRGRNKKEARQAELPSVCIYSTFQS